MSQDVGESGPRAFDGVRAPVWPMVGVCVGVLFLPWSRSFESGVLGDGKYALLLGVLGLALYALAAMRQLDLGWWRLSSAPLALGCFALAAHALDGYGALGATVTAVSAVAWLVSSRRRPAQQRARI